MAKSYPFTDKWGRDTARSRYGSNSGQKITPKFEDASYPQKLGDQSNLQGPDHDNDHPNDWVRGKGENATTKPGFDKGR